MSYFPRLIPLVLHERHHQIILGATSGTIVYCPILSLFISCETKEEFPSIAATLAILFGIVCILHFVYFLHGVSQSIHVNYIVRKSYKKTKRSMLRLLSFKDNFIWEVKSDSDFSHSISFDHYGYRNAIRLEKLHAIASQNDMEIKLLKPMGSFV